MLAPRSGRATRNAAVLTLAAFVPFALQGCVSIKLARPEMSAPAEATGAFRFLAVLKARDRGKAEAAVSGVVAALYRLEGGEERIVWRGTDGDWVVNELPPGPYRLVVERVYDDGELEEPGGDVVKDFDIAAGQGVRADVVLKKTPVGLVVVLAVTVVLLVALLVIAAQDGGLDLPDPGNLGGLVPPVPPLFPEMAESVILLGELAGEGDDGEDEGEMEESAIRSFVPNDGAVVGADAAVEIRLGAAVDPLTVDQRTFGVLAGGRQWPASIAIRDGGRTLHLAPLAPLPAGARVRARFMGDHVMQEDGSSVGESAAWSFDVRGGP